MNKEKFIKQLMKKLSILSDTEKNDIKLEYEDIIDQKIKHGKTEEEAVSEFGDINDLTDEILKAYKINPNYKGENKTFFNNVEDTIKKGAKKISDTTEEVIDNINFDSDKITFNKIIEFLVKLLVILLGLAILKIPFYVIEELGKSIFESTEFFIGDIFKVIWVSLIEVIYFVFVIFVIVSLFIKFKNSITDSDSNKIEQKKSEKPIKVNKNNKNSKNGITDIIIIILKLGIFIIFLIPLLFMNVGLVFIFIILIYLLFKNIVLIGPIILIIGLMILGFYIFDICSKKLFSNVKVYMYPFIIGMVMTILGGLLSIDYLLGFTYYNYLPESEFKTDVIVSEQTINKRTIFSDNYDIVIDNNLDDNKINIEIEYYNDFIKIDDIEKHDINSYSTYDDKHEVINQIHINYSYVEKKEFNIKNSFTDLIIDNLKNRKIYNYSKIDELNIKVYVNEKTKNLLN